MQSVINLLHAPWRDRASRTGLKRDWSMRKKTSTNLPSQRCKSSPAAATDPTVKNQSALNTSSHSSDVIIASVPASQAAGGDAELGQDDPLSSSKIPDPKGKDVAPDSVDGYWNPPRLSRSSDHASALKIHRETNQYVLAKAYELDAESTSMFETLYNLADSLNKFVDDTEKFTNADIPHGLTKAFDGLRENARTFLDDDIPHLGDVRERVDSIQRGIIQSMLRSNRYLDRVFKLNAANLALSLSPEPTLSSPPTEVEIGGETYARSYSVVRYLSQMGDIDCIQEKLTDLYLERDQLHHEQESRSRFGLSLDDESLEFLYAFGKQEQLLLDELEYAEIVVEALRQLLHDREALEITERTYLSIIDEAWEPLEVVETDTPFPRAPATRNQRHEQLQLLSELQTDNFTFTNLYEVPGLKTGDAARFINTWILDRTRNLPTILGNLTAAFCQHYSGFPTEDRRSRFLEIWFDDSTAHDFHQIRTLADEMSAQVNRADSEDPLTEEASALTGRSEPLPLLRMGPDTKVEDIIAHAVRTRSMSTQTRSSNRESTN